jgi:KDO2-lipid IV(A) lauroyltransferase
MLKLKDLRYRLEYALAISVISLLKWLPFTWVDWLAHQAGAVGFLIMPCRRQITLSNLDIAFGDTLSQNEKDKIAVGAFHSMALAAAELFLADRFLKDYRKRFTITGAEHVRKAFKKGKGVLFALSHTGSWELLAFICRLMEFRGVVIVKDIRNPYLNRAVNRLRQMMGVIPLHKDASIRHSLRELKQNNAVAILIDQWAGPEGIWLNFFGRPTSTTTIPARILQKTDCALLPMSCIRKNIGQYEILIGEAVRLEGDEKTWEIATTEKINRLFENHIRKYPEQWTWGHNRWKLKPQTLRKSK